MKDKYLREQLIKTGIVDEDVWGSSYTKDKLDRAFDAGNWFFYRKDVDDAELRGVEEKLNALVEYLNLEETFILAQPSSYGYRKKKAVKKS